MKTLIAVAMLLSVSVTAVSAQGFYSERERERFEERSERQERRERREREERREARERELRRERAAFRGGGGRSEFCESQVRAINQLERTIRSGNTSKGTIIALGDARNSYNSRCR